MLRCSPPQAEACKNTSCPSKHRLFISEALLPTAFFFFKAPLWYIHAQYKPPMVKLHAPGKNLNKQPWPKINRQFLEDDPKCYTGNSWTCKANTIWNFRAGRWIASTNMLPKLYLPKVRQCLAGTIYCMCRRISYQEGESWTLPLPADSTCK